MIRDDEVADWTSTQVGSGHSVTCTLIVQVLKTREGRAGAQKSSGRDESLDTEDVKGGTEVMRAAATRKPPRDRDKGSWQSLVVTTL